MTVTVILPRRFGISDPHFYLAENLMQAPGPQSLSCYFTTSYSVRAQWDRSPAHSSTWQAHDVLGVGLEVGELKK